MLETTILKIGGLLQVGFGEAGAQIIGKNMSSQDGADGELNIITPGRKVVAIYGFCNIRDFMETTQCLLEEVMVFVNKIARIVHLCVHEWKGGANKNIGESFLVTWMVSDPDEQRKMGQEGFQVSDRMQELTDRALIAFIKVVAEIRRASDLGAYAKHPKIIPKFGLSYRVKLGFGLHCGWAIEGAIGSKHKIDASYLSPHVNIAARVQSITKSYGVEILLTDDIHKVLSNKAKERCRKIDVVKLKGASKEIGIHCFDVNNEVQVGEGHQVGHICPPQEMSVAELAAKPLDFLFFMDQDIVLLQEGITIEFRSTWRTAFSEYSGELPNGERKLDWEKSLHLLQRCANLLPNGDGPAENLIAYINAHDCVPPSDWQGFRVLLFK